MTEDKNKLYGISSLLTIKTREFLEKMRNTQYKYVHVTQYEKREPIMYRIVLDPGILDPQAFLIKTKWRKFTKFIYNTKWKKRYWYEGTSEKNYFRDCIINVDENHPDIQYALKMSFGGKQ